MCPPDTLPKEGEENPYADMPRYKYSQVTFKMFTDEEVRTAAGKEALPSDEDELVKQDKADRGKWQQSQVEETEPSKPHNYSRPVNSGPDLSDADRHDQRQRDPMRSQSLVSARGLSQRGFTETPSHDNNPNLSQSQSRSPGCDGGRPKNFLERAIISARAKKESKGSPVGSESTMVEDDILKGNDPLSDSESTKNRPVGNPEGLKRNRGDSVVRKGEPDEHIADMTLTDVS